MPLPQISMLAIMDITEFIVGRRDTALLTGDYGTYRQQCSRRLLTLRRKLHKTTPKGRKYAAKDPITKDEVSKTPEYVILTGAQ